MCKAVEEYGKKCASEAEKRGIEQGIEQTARNLKAEGIPIEIIIKTTGLSKEVIENIK